MKATWKLLIALAVLGCFTLCAQSVESVRARDTETSILVSQEKKVMREFRGVRLGFKKEQVQAALGKPTSTPESKEEYNFDGDNQITIHYENGEVKAIQVYYATATNIPIWTEVVGDAPINQMESGAKFARKVVSADQFWVSMYQSKDGTVTRITISR